MTSRKPQLQKTCDCPRCFFHAREELSLIGGVTGLMVSFYQNLPSGAAIVCVFGVLLVLTGIVAVFIKEKPRGLMPDSFEVS